MCGSKKLHCQSCSRAPEVDRDSVAVDWLHTVELGVAQDLLGHVFWEAVNCAELWPKDCSNRALRVRALNGRLQGYYGRAKPQNRVGKLTLKMFKKEQNSQSCQAKLLSAEHCSLLQRSWLVPCSRHVVEIMNGTFWRPLMHSWPVLRWSTPGLSISMNSKDLVKPLWTLCIGCRMGLMSFGS